MNSNKNSDSSENKNKDRLDARSYRAFLKQRVKKARRPDSSWISQKEIVDYGEETGMDCLFGEELGTSKLIEPPSRGESPVVVHSDSWSGHGACKRAKIAADLDLDARIRLLDSERISTANVVSSYPFSSGNSFFEQSSVCPEFLRTKDDSQDWVFSSCEAKIGHDLAFFSEVAIQTDSCYNICVFCQCPGSHLCCNGKGCKRSCHLFCLDPLLKDAPLGLWHCPFCVEKRMKSGVHSVSEGMEFILDFKEEMQEEKYYLVKYKGLAHVHNRWIPESQMLLEAPKLVAKFNRRLQEGKVIRWKHEWAKPHRLLQRRYLMLPELADDSLSGFCHQEWLVKWKGLGYDEATWEFENSEFLCSLEGIALKKDYERRREEAKKASDPSNTDKALLLKNTPFSKLYTLPDGCSPRFDKKYLKSINKLLEFWHMGRNAVLIDDQERIVETMLFILALQSHTCRPYLIISAAAALPSWEREFAQLSPSVNIVVYNGTKDVRRMIQTVEFYDEGGRIMFQVLISHSDAVVEDLEALYCIGWEAIIVDECQKSRVSKHFERFRNLSSDFRLLLFSGPLKDGFVDYLNTLSFLDPRGQENAVNISKFDITDDNDRLAILKERLAFYVAYERKPKSSKFQEYWIPAQLSNVQLGQYCNILMSNSDALHLISKVDHVGAISVILNSARKCCDHPYLVDNSLACSLTKDLSLVEKSKFEVNASGKLRLLDKILRNIKTHGLRVLILFQSIDASGKISTGDILDDFLNQRFGANSYEHFINGMTRAKKEAALERFNDKESGRFVFLIGNSACTSSIRLSSVHTVIIYGSDWNPLNDLRVLHKISIGSHLKQVKVFRLYSSWTVEEKVLIFAKQDMVIGHDTQNMSPSISHSLLSWGASYLFDKLHRLLQHNYQSHDWSTSTEKLLMNEVMRLLMQSSNMATITDNSNCSIVVKAQLTGMRYSQNILLFGESENTLSLGNDPLTFWSKLLNRSCPQSKCTSEPPQGTQKKVHQLDELVMEPEGSDDESRKKHKIIVNSTINSAMSVPLQMLTETGEAVNGKAAKVSENTPPSGSDHPFLICTSQEPPGPNISTNETGVPISQAKLGSMCQSCSGTIMNDAVWDLHMPAMSLSSDVDELEMWKLGEKEKLLNAPKDLLSSINPKLLKFCETLRLPDEVKHLAELFLMYIMKNHHFSLGSETLLEGFIISLCWMAASLQKHKINHKESLALAKRYLNFECKEQEVELVYAKLKFLKDFFSHPSGVSENTVQPNSLMIETFFPKHDIHKGIIHEEISGRSSSDHHVMEKCEIRVCESSVPENNTAKDFMHEVNLKKTLSDDEVLEEGEIRESLSSMPSKYAVIYIMHDDSSETASYGDEKMKEGEIRKDLTSMQAQNVFRCVVHEDSSKIVPFDHEGIGEASIRMGQLSVPVNDDIKDNMCKTGPKLTSMDGELEKDEIRKSPVGHTPSEQQNLVNRFSQSSVPGNDDHKDCMHETSPKLTLLDDELEEGELGKSPVAHMPCVQLNLVQQEQNSILETPLVKTHQQIKSLKDELLKKQMDLIDRICSRRLDELLLRQNIELLEFKIMRDEQKMELIKIHNLELDQIHGMHTGPVVREHKIKLLEQDLAKRMNEFNQHMKCQHRRFVRMQIKARNKEKQIRDRWLEEAKAGVLETCFDKLPLSVTGFKLEKFKHERHRYESSVDNKAAASSSDLTRGPVEHFEPSNQPDSMSNCTNIVESHEPSRPSSNISPIIQYVSADNMPLKSANPASHSNEMNAICDEFDGGPRQGQSESCFFSHASECSGCDASASWNQVPSIGKQEKSAVSRVGGDRCSSTLSNAFPASCSVDAGVQEVDLSIHNLTVSDLGLPPSVGLPGTPAPLGSDQELCNHVYCSSELTESSAQQSVLGTAAQPGQSNHKFSQPLPPSIGLTSGMRGHTNTPATVGSDQKPCNQIHCSAQLTERSLQQPVVAAAAQLGQSRKQFSQPFVHLSPPITDIPSTRTPYPSNTDVQPEAGSNFPLNCAMLPSMPQQDPYSNPLHDELMRLHGFKDSFSQWHEEMKLQLRLECDREFDKLRRKYDALIQDAEIKLADSRPRLDIIYKKIQRHQKLVEGFQETLNEIIEGAANAYKDACSSTMQQSMQVARPQFAQGPVEASASRRAPAESNSPPSSTPLPLSSSRLRPPASTAASVPPVQEMQKTTTIFSNNPVRPHFSLVLPTHGDHQFGSVMRAPAPHLRASRPPISSSNRHLESKRPMNQ
uniref:LOW QUALITY PROTEIN: uncharacterized protein LOC105051204 n=1 Tax=Elaeis guineensis var. tenera TaxID=51953 RepID=A0A8N4F775_ELAGV|nr:LOW QUALITY PROTEIN: uncharacterized protein LOC105051204 [Elaeis guineensis]